MNNYSPLRYPGGKAKIAPLVKCMINKSTRDLVYIEPFAGGAGVALDLLLDGVVDSIVINDYDKSIYSFWKSILSYPKQFIELLERTPVSVEEREKQRQIYLTRNSKFSLELGFATFYLNRTNHSGIIKAGPIGGIKQNGLYKIDARFNKNDLINKIKLISRYKNKIHLYNKEVRTFIDKILPKYPNHFIYFDPPYYKKGKDLYKNFFTDRDHIELSKKIKGISDYWMVTYDNEESIKKIYSEYLIKTYRINHSAANTGKTEEIIFLSNNSLWPSEEELKQLNTSINFLGGTNE